MTESNERAGRVDCGDCPSLAGCNAGYCMRAELARQDANHESARAAAPQALTNADGKLTAAGRDALTTGISHIPGAPQAQPSTAEYLRRTAIPKPDPDFHKRADEPPQAQPSEPSISIRRSEWESLSPEAQAALEQLTGAGSREEALARAQAAQDMRGKSLLTQAQPAPAEQPDTRALILQCRQALDEELAGWDLDPPLDHVLKARDACVRWLARSPAPALISDERIFELAGGDDTYIEFRRDHFLDFARALLAEKGTPN